MSVTLEAVCLFKDARPHHWAAKFSNRREALLKNSDFSSSCPAKMFPSPNRRRRVSTECSVLPNQASQDACKALHDSVLARKSSLRGSSEVFQSRKEVVDWIRATCHQEDPFLGDDVGSNALNSPCACRHEDVSTSEAGSANKFSLEHGKDRLGTLDFDALEYSADTLVDLCLEIFSEAKLGEDLGLSRDLLRAFILGVRCQMVENPYHNWFHVVDVVQSGLFHEMPSTERLGLLIAALCHDLDHPGVTNAFLIKTQSALASQYGMDASCLEKHHSCRASELLSNDERSGLLDGLEPAPRQQIMQCVERIIMATDMGRHGEYVARLSSLAARRRQGAEEGGAAERRHVVVAVDDEERHTMTELLIKCADMSNVLKPFPVAKKWAMRITDEFFKQGDLERSLGMDVTPTCDRHSQSRVALQKGFIAFVRPFYRAVGDLLPALRPLADRLQSTLDMWETYASDEALLAEM